MFKQSLFALAAASTVLAAAVPTVAEARHHRRYARTQTVSRSQVFQGRDGRYYCRRGNGTVGLVVGSVGGALLGRAVDTQGDRLPGTLIGAAAGALAGREAEKQIRCR
ncbi:MAG: glycine zipper 2TM domain-containing protein [Croceibacterium sp.]